jgi:hypothetical protein
LCWLAAVALLLGGVGLASAPIAVRLLVPVPLGLALLLGAVIRSRAEKTAAGELLAAAALSSVGLLVAVAAGISTMIALSAWGAWCVAFGSATIAVRTVISSARQPIAMPRRIGVPLAVTAIGLVLVTAGLVPAFVFLAFVPTLALTLGLSARPPSPRRLRGIGWMLVGATTFAAATLAGGSRLGPSLPSGSSRIRHILPSG